MNPNLVLTVEKGLGIFLIIVGLSHMAAAGRWSGAYAGLFGKAWGALLVGALLLPLGVAIVLLHNVWVAHFAVVTTLVGWACVIKATVCLLAPAFAEGVARKFATPGKIAVAGLLHAIIGAVIIAGAALAGAGGAGP